MKKLIRNKNTGILEVWENGVKIGEIITIGDSVTAEEFPNGSNSKS